MVDAPCICMAEPEAFQDELIGRIRTPYEIHVDLHMAGAGWVRGPLGRQRARPASIRNMPPRAPPAGVCAAGGARRSRTSLAGPGGVPIYKLICEKVCRVSSVRKKRESHFLFCTPHPCPEWGVSLYFEKCLPAFCVVGGIDCVRDSKVGTP